MVDLVHFSLDIILVGVSLTLFIYCMKMLQKFLEKGMFEATFKAFAIAGFLLAVGTVFDIIAETFETVINLHWFHVSLDILSIAVILYGVRRLYQAFIKLSR